MKTDIPNGEKCWVFSEIVGFTLSLLSKSFPAQIFCLRGQNFRHESRTEKWILKDVKEYLNPWSRNQAGSLLRAGLHLKLKTQSSYHHEPNKSNFFFLLKNKSYARELRISLFFLLSWFKPVYSGTLAVYFAYIVVGKRRKKRKFFWYWLWWLKHKIISKFFCCSRDSEGCLAQLWDGVHLCQITANWFLLWSL